MTSTMDSRLVRKRVHSSRKAVEEAIDRSKSSKELSWGELVPDGSDADATYADRQCGDHSDKAGSSSS